MSVQRLDERRVEGLSLQCSPDPQDQAAARDQHTSHLAEPRSPVRKEFESVLTQHDVEGRLREGEHRRCIALAPLDGWTVGPLGHGMRHAEHAFVHIYGHNLPCRANHLGRQTG
jgi:hypothetical protein